MTDRQIALRIGEWLADFARDKERQRDDIHIDRISATFIARRSWPQVGLDCLLAATDIAKSSNETASIAVQFFLEATAERRGPPEGPLESLSLSWTPPALTVYRRGAAPWSREPEFRAVPPWRYVAGHSLVAFFQDWYDEQEGDYDGRLWLVSSWKA